MFKTLVIVAVILRIFLMPISAHSDLFFINFFPNLFFTEGVIDIFSYVDQNLKDKQYTYYPPATYYTFVFFQSLYHLFSDSYSNWMSAIYNLEIVGFSGQVSDILQNTNNPFVFRDIFLSKSPYLFFDLAIAGLLFKLIKNSKEKKSLVILWLFNPITLYSTYLMGQYDMIPTFFTTLGFYLVFKRKLKVGLLSLGMAAAYKNYPFLLIVPVVLIYEKTLIQRAKLLAISLIPYLLFITPTIIADAKLTFYVFIPKIYVELSQAEQGWAHYSQAIKYVLLATSTIAIFALASVIKISNKWKTSLGFSLLALLLTYTFAPRISFHYLLWAIPLIVLWTGKLKPAALFILVQSLSFASYNLLATNVNVGLFSPLNPALDTVTTFNEEIDKIIPYRYISTLGYLIFIATNVFLSVKIINNLVFQQPVKSK